MIIDPYHRKNIDDFFAEITPIKAAYTQDTFAYIAVRQGDEFHLVQGAWNMNPVPATTPLGVFQSDNIIAGRFRCADLKLDPRKFVEQIFEGRVATPNGDLLFQTENDGRLSTYFTPFTPVGLQGQSRTALLSIGGEHLAPLLRQPNLDWELKSHPTPYENIQELMNEYQVGGLRNQSTNIDFTAFSIAAIDISSTISDDIATLAIQLSHGLSPEKVAIRFRLVTANNSVQRNSIPGGSLTWRNEAGYQIGTTKHKVPKGAYMQCTVTYNDIGMNHRWVGDPTLSPNTRRVAYEIYDKQVSKIREVIAREQQVGQRARDFESIAAWLLWMLGFSVAHLNLPGTSEAPDLLAVTPLGNYAVVECTTGLLRADGKLANLQARAQELRRAFDMSGNSFVRILPIVVTTKYLKDVASEIDQAERHGVLVLTRENIESALDRARLLPNAEQLFADGEEAVKTKLAKYAKPQSG